MDPPDGKGEKFTFKHQPTLTNDQWQVNSSTGMIVLTDDAIDQILNLDPIEKRYTIDPEPIARGQYATVYRCRHRVTEEAFAAKFCSRMRLGSDCTASILHEIAICLMLRQTNRAVQLVEVFSTETQLILVMEYAPGGDLQTFFENLGDQDLVPYERDVVRFLRQLLEGLVFMHDRNIVHLDIK